MPSDTARRPADSAAAIHPIPMLDLQRQYANIKSEIQAALERVLTSQHFIGGEELEGFEHESAASLGAAHCVGCASGTDALWLALQTSGVSPGTAVVTTPFSFFASVSSIIRCGATPLLADIDPATLNLDAVQVQQTLLRTKMKVSALLPVHLFGQCVNMDQFDQITNSHQIPLVEDAAQAFGAKWKNKRAGTLGKAAAFSFYPTKNLSAYGDAGCVTTDDDEVAEHVRRLRNHGTRQRYYHDEIGVNSRLDAMQAAVLRVKLQHLDQWNQQRRILACRYHGLLGASGLLTSGTQPLAVQSPLSLLATNPEAFHIYHQYVIRALRRDELRAFLTQQGIATEVYYPLPLHLQQCFAYLGYKPGDFPESERAAKEVLALPMFPELREDEQRRVVAAITQFYSR